ncbi:hypothetical protein [Fodinibius salsisoli]|uniref:Adenosine deaminase n=1 Tax=Fodinibius salsisoli TaxID=2820877 RepID=A0ABT3PM19_9BACT|nr:hypothetical protein [Fodinibius salsisoli]MCW9706967.1 hypothetical protein [Fodinibius salsisoli]
MYKSFEAFMERIVDYAGLFPPADLSLESALINYETYRRSSDVWMLSRFIIPVSKLQELSPYGESLFTEKKPWDFSVLGKRTETLSEFSAYLDETVAAMEQLHTVYPGSVTTDMFEIALPREVVFANDQSLVAEACRITEKHFGDDSTLPGSVFFEAYFEESWQKDISEILKGIEVHNNQPDEENGIHAGFKLRCGGVEKRAFPSIEQIAFVIRQAKEYNVALKATAGLHHPVRHYAEEVQTKMHGFFNVFGGAMLNAKFGLSQKNLEQILRDEDAEHFEFTDVGFKWQEWSLSVEEITKLRNEVITTFGSCSFDDPREDLKKLQWM